MSGTLKAGDEVWVRAEVECVISDSIGDYVEVNVYSFDGGHETVAVTLSSVQRAEESPQ